MRIRTFLLGTILLSSLATAAMAAPLRWTLSGVTFSDGGSASGSFLYDAGTNTYSDINIVTTTGGVRTGANHTALSNGVAPSSSNVLVTIAGSGVGSPALYMTFGAGLTNAGGLVSITGGQEASCLNAACTSPGAPSRTIVAGGTVTGAPIPSIPTLSTTALAGLAVLLAACAWLSLRNATASA